ncbi:MAG: hypothetical protein J0L60_06570 [Ignavibacteria bacterium]|nr:hypothetical protein [Ignavibacteria bacterium]
MKWTERGLRKYSAFLISLLAYCVIFSVTVFAKYIDSANIPAFAFQLGVGIASVTGVFYAGNVLSKKVGYEQRILDYSGNYPVVGDSAGIDNRQETQSQRSTGI